jgi:hypothetical protein
MINILMNHNETEFRWLLWWLSLVSITIGNPKVNQNLNFLSNEVTTE